MPEISRFFGIVITMYYESGRHQRPHFHARYGISQSEFHHQPRPRCLPALAEKTTVSVLAWAELHQIELLENWERVTEEQPLTYIAGL